MKYLAAILLLALLLSRSAAQTALPDLPQPTASRTGKFLAFGVPGSIGPPIRSFLQRTNTALVDLEPWVLVVCCERIKEAIWDELNVSSQPRGTIILFLHRAQSADDSVIITPQLFGNKWNYRIDLPETVNQERFLAAMTHVLLLDIANQNTGARSAEIPAWLREGLTRQVLVPRQVELIPAIPQWNASGISSASIHLNQRITNSLWHAHEVLTASSALTFGELSFPAIDDLQGERGEVFRGSAQLFVARLLASRNGSASLRRMVESLPRYYNWQFALLNAFRNQFHQLLDVEKWWAVNVVQFTGHDLVQSWPEEESRRQLDDIIHPEIEVRTAEDQLPLRTDTTLQLIIRDWMGSEQDAALKQIVNQLAVVKFRLRPDFAALAENYQTALAEYLKNRAEFNRKAGHRLRIGEAAHVRRILNALDSLDKQRVALRPQTRPLAEAKKPLTAGIAP